MGRTDDHPSLWRPSMFAFTWQVSAWAGWGLFAWAIVQLSPSALSAMGPPLAMIVAVVVLSELRPVVMTRLEGNPVSISLAFVFATMYVWGIAPAVALIAGSVILAELLQRKPLWKIVFNVGQYVLSLTAAWLVVWLAGEGGTPFDPNVGLSGSDLWWIIGSWAVYHLANLAFVAGLAHSDGQTWWESFSEEFLFYTVSVAAVLALSPLIAVVAVADSGSWALLPLLLLPLLAVQKAAEMSRETRAPGPARPAHRPAEPAPPGRPHRPGPGPRHAPDRARRGALPRHRPVQGGQRQPRPRRRRRPARGDVGAAEQRPPTR